MNNSCQAISEKHPEMEISEEEHFRDLPSFNIPHFIGKPTVCLYKGTWLPKVLCTEKTLKLLEEFAFEDDILIASFPKSGTTWTQEIVSQIEMLYREDGEAWKSIIVEKRIPVIEHYYPGIEEIAKLKPPRFLKTHLPYDALPSSIINGVKIIYTARDPKDVCVSSYHFNRMMKRMQFKGSFLEFFDLFISGKIGWGPWEKNVLSYWEKRNDKNILFLTYEGMHQNPQEAIRKISDFIGKPVTNDQIDAIAENSKFDKMKDDPSTNYVWWEEMGESLKSESSFFRKGIVGDWINYMDENMLKRVEELFEKNPALREIFQ